MEKNIIKYSSLLAYKKNSRIVKGIPSISPSHCGFSYSQGRNPSLTMFSWFCA